MMITTKDIKEAIHWLEEKEARTDLTLDENGSYHCAIIKLLLNGALNLLDMDTNMKIQEAIDNKNPLFADCVPAIDVVKTILNIEKGV